MTNTPDTSMPRVLVPRIFRPGDGYGIPFLPDLHLGLSFAGSRTPVRQQDLEAWDLPFELALAEAIANLQTITRPDQLIPIESVEGLYAVATSNGTAATRALVLPQLIPNWPADGVLVASPTTNQLLVVPLDGPRAIGAFRAILMATEATQTLRIPVLSDQLYWTDGERWEHVRLTHHEDTVEVEPPPGFLDLFHRLAGYSLIAEPIYA